MAHDATQRQALVSATHAFFERWLAGSVPDTDQAWDQQARSQHPHMVLVSPDGGMLQGAALSSCLRVLHGHTRDGPRTRIWHEGYSEQHLEGSCWLVSYVECHEHDGVPMPGLRRRATAVLQQAPGAPHGWVWRSVHETHVPPPRAGEQEA